MRSARTPLRSSSVVIAALLFACESSAIDAGSDSGVVADVSIPKDATEDVEDAEDAADDSVDADDEADADGGGDAQLDGSTEDADAALACTRGALDPNFGDNGVVFFNELIDGELRGLAIDNADRIVAAASLRHRGVQFGVLRFDERGAPDPTFGRGGVAYPSLDPFLSNQANVTAMLLLPDRSILTIGSVQMIHTELLLIRQQEDGSLDSNFGVAGRTRLTLTSSATDTLPNAMSLATAEDALDVAGVLSSIAGTRAFVARFRVNGSLDPAHSVYVSSSAGDHFAAIVSTPDRGALTAGTRASDMLLVKTSSIGALSSEVVDDRAEDESARAVFEDALGRTVIAGFAGAIGMRRIALRRYLSDGSADPSFGVAGASTATVALTSGEATDLVELSDGRLLVAGLSTDFTSTDPLLARFDDDGTLDLSFGTGGILTLSIDGGVNARLTRAVAASDGAIIAGGVTDDARAFIARICP